MSSNNDNDIKDASLHGGGDRITPSQSNQQKDKEARRDAEDRLRNFNYAKSIGADGKDDDEGSGVKPLSPLAQRYLGTLKVGSSSSSSNGDGEQDGGGKDFLRYTEFHGAITDKEQRDRNRTAFNDPKNINNKIL